MATAAMLALAAAGCGTELVCPSDQVACGGVCAAVRSDPRNCGACGVACAAGDACSSGACALCSAACTSSRGCQGQACLPDVEVACFATDEVRPLAGDLSAAGPPQAVDHGPVSLASLGGRTWVAHSLAPPSVVGLDPAGGSLTRVVLGGGDLEAIRAHAGAYGRADGLLYVCDVEASSLVVVDPVRAASDPSAAAIDEVSLRRDPTKGENPRGVAFTSSKAYVALYGDAFDATFAGKGQAIAVVDLPLFGCGPSPCVAAAHVEKHISLEGVAGAYDPGGFPFPSGAVAVGTRAFVALANLKLNASGYYGDPAGPGKLLVIDAAAGDALSVVELPGCNNPGSLAVDGATVWVACGGTAAVLPVDVSGLAPVPGAALPVGVVSGGLAFCGGAGYVTDQYSGKVVRFDATGATATVDVCPASSGPFGFAWASDVACAP
jgi:hypothetical protein